MHIPDGYLSPQTCAVATVVMVPVWGTAARKVRETIKRREVPLLALAASYTFLVMMLNVPIPDGTTAHAVGAVLIAILLGPWAAVIAVSVALLIQAMFFGDGGVLAFGANAFNMAFLGPFVGYGVYRLISRRVPLASGRRVLAAGVGAYVGINASALAAAIEFGIQPDLFTAADGTPLYAPFHLAQTIPAMALAHLTVAGGVEAALTAGVFAYLQRNNLPVLRINRAALPPSELGVGAVVGGHGEGVAHGEQAGDVVGSAGSGAPLGSAVGGIGSVGAGDVDGVDGAGHDVIGSDAGAVGNVGGEAAELEPELVGASASASASVSASARSSAATATSAAAPSSDDSTRSPWKWAMVGIIGLALLTPLGLIAEGGAFGEDAPRDLDLGRYGLNAIPSGLSRYNGFWSHTVLGDYGFGSGDNATLGYLLSAAVGIAVVSLSVLAIWLVARWVSRSKADAESGSSPVALPGTP